jgi:hypothetical protein
VGAESGSWEGPLLALQEANPAGASWDLGHVDGGGRHPEHRASNRRTVSHLKEQLAGEPERFDPGEPAPRWSRHWYGGFDPRCRQCRETGEPCEVALRLGGDEAA